MLQPVASNPFVRRGGQRQRRQMSSVRRNEGTRLGSPPAVVPACEALERWALKPHPAAERTAVSTSERMQRRFFCSEERRSPAPPSALAVLALKPEPAAPVVTVDSGREAPSSRPLSHLTAGCRPCSHSSGSALMLCVARVPCCCSCVAVCCRSHELTLLSRYLITVFSSVMKPSIYQGAIISLIAAVSSPLASAVRIVMRTRASLI